MCSNRGLHDVNFPSSYKDILFCRLFLPPPPPQQQQQQQQEAQQQGDGAREGTLFVCRISFYRFPQFLLSFSFFVVVCVFYQTRRKTNGERV